MNNDAVQAKWFRLFISWLTSSNSLEETAKTCGVSPRTLQRRFTPFWLIQPPWGCPQVVDTLFSCLGVKQRFSYSHFDQRAGLRNRRGLPSR
ncbi:hypothetical protein RAE06_11655, partial [Corynebacterium tuberculostearicum]|nr:hypothetical protein [Corynebacterium tuberculostearicum]